MPKIEITQEKIEQALKACCTEDPAESDPCQNCYLYRLRDDTGHMSTGRSCFEHLAFDIIDYIRRINDFEHSQCAKLIEDNGAKARRITELEKVMGTAAAELRDYSANPCYLCNKWENGRCTLPPPKDCGGYYRWTWHGFENITPSTPDATDSASMSAEKMKKVVFRDGICPQCGGFTHGSTIEPMHCEKCGWVGQDDV